MYILICICMYWVLTVCTIQFMACWYPSSSWFLYELLQYSWVIDLWVCCYRCCLMWPQQLIHVGCQNSDTRLRLGTHFRRSLVNCCYFIVIVVVFETLLTSICFDLIFESLLFDSGDEHINYIRLFRDLSVNKTNKKKTEQNNHKNGKFIRKFS